jgi:hypothetical protein
MAAGEGDELATTADLAARVEVEIVPDGRQTGGQAGIVTNLLSALGARPGRNAHATRSGGASRPEPPPRTDPPPYSTPAYASFSSNPSASKNRRETRRETSAST